MGSSESTRTVSVLLVEDNLADILLVKEALKQCPVDVNLITARDGEEALRFLLKERLTADLVVLDLNIPKIDGLTVLERYQPKTAPVVVFSSSCTGPDVRKAFSLGASDCVRKPLDLEQFMKEVCDMIERWTAPMSGAPVL